METNRYPSIIPPKESTDTSEVCTLTLLCQVIDAEFPLVVCIFTHSNTVRLSSSARRVKRLLLLSAYNNNEPIGFTRFRDQLFITAVPALKTTYPPHWIMSTWMGRRIIKARCYTAIRITRQIDLMWVMRVTVAWHHRYQWRVPLRKHK